MWYVSIGGFNLLSVYPACMHGGIPVLSRYYYNLSSHKQIALIYKGGFIFLGDLLSSLETSQECS